jgi:hypothetical protein
VNSVFAFAVPLLRFQAGSDTYNEDSAICKRTRIIEKNAWGTPAMPSASLLYWQNGRMSRLQQVDLQCGASLAAVPPNAFLIDENLRGYVVLLSFTLDLTVDPANTPRQADLSPLNEWRNVAAPDSFTPRPASPIPAAFFRARRSRRCPFRLLTWR